MVQNKLLELFFSFTSEFGFSFFVYNYPTRDGQRVVPKHSKSQRASVVNLFCCWEVPVVAHRQPTSPVDN